MEHVYARALQIKAEVEYDSVVDALVIRIFGTLLYDDLPQVVEQVRGTLVQVMEPVVVYMRELARHITPTSRGQRTPESLLADAFDQPQVDAVIRIPGLEQLVRHVF